ncbi:MAG: YitT family protein, partial [Atopobiaceae bacterium]|nr:YitT family protein [Atopobiaceae bacterium]
ILFKAPNHFALGGTSGLSIILSTLFPTLPVSAFMWILNAVLVGLGLVFLDHRTMGWTIYASFALSAYTSILELAIPMAAPLTHDTLLELCFAVLLPAIGSAIVFNVGASTGGTDIVAMILKRRTSLEIGKALMVSDGVIVGVAFLLYGPQTGLYCVLGLIAKAFVVDNVIESLNLRKVCTVISHDPEAVLGFLVRTLDRTATVRDAVGGFSMQPEEEVVAVLTRREAALLQMWLRRHDPTAFMTMVNSSEILGKGFRSV